jgi:hypothetical protein
MGAFDAIPGSMRPPSARHLKPGVKPPTEVDTLLQASGRLLLCGINSVRLNPGSIEPRYAFSSISYLPL